MSPTILLYKNYRFFFNSREETRMHVHVATPDGTAKYWLEPIVSLADYYNMPSKELKELMIIVEGKKDDFIDERERHFNQ